MYYTVNDEEENDFHTCLNFPGSEEIIEKQMKDFIKKDASEAEAKISQILGFCFQLEFYSIKIHIYISYKKAGESEYTDLEMQCLGTTEKLVEDMQNLLLDRPISHPAIDYIGVFAEERRQKWIVFFQMSLSKYACHGSKLNDLCIISKDFSTGLLYKVFQNE